MASIVYMATNRINGKRYIGVTSRGLTTRRRDHENAPGAKRTTCRYFHSAMRKYGPGSFDWAVLAEHECFTAAMQDEIRTIAEFKPEYNLTVGGQGSKGRVVSQAQRDLQSQKLKGIKPTPEMIAKAVAKTRGQKRTLEQRARMSASRKGMKFSLEHKRNLAIARASQIVTEETREKRRLAKKDWRPSVEMTERSRAATKGKKRPPEIIRKMREGLLRWQAQRKMEAEGVSVSV